MSTSGGHPTSQWSWRGLEPGPQRALGRTGATRGGRLRHVPTFKTHVSFDLEPSPLEDVSGGHWKRAQEWGGLHQTATKFQGLLPMGNPRSHSGIQAPLPQDSSFLGSASRGRESEGCTREGLWPTGQWSASLPHPHPCVQLAGLLHVVAPNPRMPGTRGCVRPGRRGHR